MKRRSPELPFNPFADVAVGDPWKSREPDVPSVNRNAFDGLLNLLGALDRTPNVAGLVLGEAGSGKTHLIKRLIASRDVDLIFVYVHPMKDHRRMFSSLLQTITADLEGPPPGCKDDSTATQLDLIVAHAMVAGIEEYLRAHPDDGFHTFLGTVKRSPLKISTFRGSRKWNSILHNSRTCLSRRVGLKGHMAKTILRVLLQYSDQSKRDAISTFLSGFAPDVEESRLLNLRLSEGDLTIEAQEVRSKEILKTLGKLLGYCRPMILCFDQLENLDSPKLVDAFGKMINDIVNEIDNVLPVGFVRAETWNNFLESHLDEAAKGRLRSNVFTLTGCNLDQALEIVEARLKWARSGSKGSQYPDLHPFQRDMLERHLIGITSPREVLIAANRHLAEVTRKGMKVAPEEPVAVLQESFEAEREKLLALTKKAPTKRDTVVAALKLYFLSRTRTEKYRVLSVNTEGAVDLIIRISRTDTPSEVRTVDIVVETATHWKPLQKVLHLMKRRIDGKQCHSALLVRDARQKIPPQKGRMPKTVRAREALESSGGRVLYLEYSHLADLCALVYSSDKIGAGDLTYIADSTGMRKPVAKSTRDSFVQVHFHCEFLTRIEEAFLGEPTMETAARDVSRA